MIFDSLTHVTQDGRWFNSTYDASEKRLLLELEQAEVTNAVVVALAGYISNEFVLDLCQRHPAILMPGASFNPSSYSKPQVAAHEFRTELYGAPYAVLKLHPRLNRYDPLDSRCLAVLEELASWSRPLPVWLDTLFYYRGGTLQKSVPCTIHELVGRFPNLTFVMLHAGGSWALSLSEALRDCPNAFLDLSYTLSRYTGSSVWSDLRFLLETFDRRMVYGSDFPEFSIASALDKFRTLADGLPLDKWENVLCRNLQRIMMNRE